MSDFFTVSVLVATLASGIRLATPFLLSALGETIGQRAGVLNLGVEGVMLIGAYAAYITALRTGSVVAGVIAAMAAGAAMGVVYAFITVVMHATQGISGIGIFLFGLGFTDLLFRQQVGTPVPIDGLRGLDMGGLSDLPIVGELLFSHNMLTYVAFALVPVVWFAMNRTTFGLNVRAVGETPEAADTLGVRVNVVRTQAIIIGNVMAGLAGGTLALDVGIFQQNLTSGQGFIAVALVYFGAWRSSGVMAGALLFGVVSSTVLQLKTLGIIVGANSTIAAMAPAILTIVVLVLVSRRIGAPSALTVPFERDN
ncbi:MAG: ABC transporter permease [Acidimicrobiales bacterium]|uniref:ABC transporter permease n=1 Tax=Candidatus Poriferisodalis multihospitum TaxID=2983191 RepID=UPI0013861AFC|nr:ABC transporter permease [Candidatus Poriferisodalis multihospitum]MCY3609511.1 ABC transporter permease [Acidimicrobiaceae bacterium]MXV87567.1 ABC transporter permease [Acidimicrobiales bacterium]MDE0678469.1 ABC transporter permease [Acidimicrobiaceae bacterium]MXY02088.1 ABC transporter permease [Acidimicrobiales bacterium]MYB82464.1 ABC transporter permease [Acidimicrobiales bacterium]